MAYGALLPRAALDIPLHGWVNLHFSLLPAWRGAAPVQHALLAGDDMTGATTFRLEEGMDTGPYYGMVTEPIGRRATPPATCWLRLAESGARLLVATLDGIADGTLEARPQPADGVSLAPKLTPDDVRLRWHEPAVVIDRLVAGSHPGTRRLDHLSRAPDQDRPGRAHRGVGPRPGRADRARRQGARRHRDGRRAAGHASSPRASRRWPLTPGRAACGCCPAIGCSDHGGQRPGTTARATTCCAPSASAVPTRTCCCRS